MTLLYLEEVGERIKVGFNPYDSLVGYSKKTPQERQQYCDNYLTILKTAVPSDKKTDTTPVKYMTMGGVEYTVPKWFTLIQGHQLVSYVKTASPFLGKYKDDKALYKKIINYCYGNYPEIIPMEVVETLREIQES